MDKLKSTNTQMIIVYPPFSPNDTNVPAGILVLKSCLYHHDINIAIADLNIQYINNIGSSVERNDTTGTFGDHCKTTWVKAASDAFFKSIEYPDYKKENEINCILNAKSLPYSFEEIDEIVDKTLTNKNDWKNFFDTYFFEKYDKTDIVGFSIMGTTQLILSFMLSRLIKARWGKTTTIIAGGTHITLKRDHLPNDERYFKYFDYFLPFHSEDVLRECIANGNFAETDGVIAYQKPYREGKKADPYLGFYVDKKDLIHYKKEVCTIPLQIETGCRNGNCAMCTYNFIEVPTRDIDIEKRLDVLLKFQNTCNIRNISFKDSNMHRNNLKLIANKLMDMDIKWNACTHIDSSFTIEDFKILKLSGCENLELGVESIHPHIQEIIGKRYSLDNIERFIEKAIGAGISLVINLIFGFPTETLEDTEKQLDWFNKMKQKYLEKISGSLNMLEINHGSRMAKNPEEFAIKLGELYPWAFSYSWNAPEWRSDFAKKIET